MDLRQDAYPAPMGIGAFLRVICYLQMPSDKKKAAKKQPCSTAAKPTSLSQPRQN